MKKITTLACSLAIVMIDNAAQGPDPYKLIEESEREISNIQAASFHAFMMQTGNRKGKNMEVSAEVTFSRENAENIPHFLAKASIHKPGFNQTDSERIVHNGNMHQFDFTNNGYKNFGPYADKGKQYSGMNSIVWMHIFFNSNPYRIDVTDTILYEGSKAIEDTRCFSVLIKRKSTHSRVFINVRSKLPVMIENFAGDNSGSTQFIFRNFRLISKPGKEFFSVSMIESELGPDSTATKLSLVSSGAHLLEKGQKAPGWELFNTEGIKKGLKDYEGRLVLLDFWASWCSPCKLFEPLLLELYNQYQEKGLSILGMNYHETTNAEKYFREKKLPFEIILNAESIAEKYKVFSIPVIYIINGEGTIMYASTGYDETTVATIKTLVQNYFCANSGK